MKDIHRYNFYKTKYGEQLLADVVAISEFSKYIQRTPIHRLTYVDITFITHGSEELTINQAKLVVKPGDVIYSVPGDVWIWEKQTALQGYALVFEEDFFLSFFSDKLFLRNLSYLHANRASPLLRVREDLFAQLVEYLEQARKEIQKGAEKSHHVIRALVYLVLALLDGVGNEQGARACLEAHEQQANRHLQGFTKLVEEHCLQVHEVQFYADKLCITTNYLNKIATEFLGTTSKKYILNKVTQEAKNLLLFTDLSMAEISEKLHFETPNYFARHFKKYSGVTPKAFRNSAV